MRKKLLRSRSGFEKPESREEAIMQNILGASNVLEPSESNIEEILKSILYNTPYTKEAEFEIEKILLAIKNNGTYDGEGESRDMKILIAVLNDLDYTEEAESRIEELFIEWLHQRSSIKVLEGIPPLTFTSRGLPLINYLIEGNTTQSGTPTPENPIQPQECGERTGNLFDKDTWNGVSAQRGTIEVVTNGFKLTATSNDAYTNTYGSANPQCSYRVVGGETYTLSWEVDDTNISGRVYIFTGITAGGTVLINTDASQKKASFTIPSGHNYVAFRLGVSTSGDSITYTNIMLNLGSTAKPHEPFGYKIPILSGNTTTPVYLGEVQSTRRIKKLVLTGEEAFTNQFGTNLFSVIIQPLGKMNAFNSYCTHYKYNPVQSGLDRNTQNGDFALQLQSTQTLLAFKDIAYSSAADFKTYIQQQYAAGTPVCVWYVLATPTTGIVNEPIRKIGDYADTVSMEQAGATIPTNNGSTTIDVDTTVKPSNIYIEYK